MSLFDESFPADIYQNSSCTDHTTITDSLLPNNYKVERSIYERSNLSLICNEDPPSSSSSSMTGPLSIASSSTESNSQDKSYDDSTENTTNSGNSEEKIIDDDCYSITNLPTKIILKKQKFINHKSKSYQDLHSEYTKKKYQHVQSKVQQYVANMKAQDNRRKSKTKYHVCLPEIISNNSYGSLLGKSTSEPVSVFQNATKNLNTEKTDNVINNVDISKILFEKDQVLNELKKQNDYLQSNINDKIALAARYKRNADLLQIELLQLKERERRFKETNYNRYGQRTSLPTSYLIYSAGKASASTQTDFLPEKLVNDENYLNFSDTLDFLKMNGNSGRGGNTSKNKIDSLIIFNLDNGITDNDDNNIPTSHNNILCNKLRRRSNSNSMKFKNNTFKSNVQPDNGTSSLLSEKSLDVQIMSKNSGSDSAIESDELLHIDDDGDNDEDVGSGVNRSLVRNLKYTKRAADAKTNRIGSCGETSKIKQKNKIKKRTFKKIYLKTIFGSCIKCCKHTETNSNNNDTISYKEISMSESMFMNN